MAARPVREDESDRFFDALMGLDKRRISWADIRSVIGILVVLAIVVVWLIGTVYKCRAGFPADPLAALDTWQERIMALMEEEKRQVERGFEVVDWVGSDPSLIYEGRSRLRDVMRRLERDQLSIRYQLSPPPALTASYREQLLVASDDFISAAIHRANAMQALLRALEFRRMGEVSVIEAELGAAKADEAAALRCIAQVRQVLEAQERSAPP